MHALRKLLSEGSVRNVSWWVSRLVVFAFSTALFVSMGAYGCGDDDEDCDYSFESTLDNCENQAADFACDDFNYFEGLCTLTDCICAVFQCDYSDESTLENCEAQALDLECADFDYFEGLCTLTDCICVN